MRILLIQPRYNDHISFGINVMVEPLALELLASSVPEHHEVRIVDLRFESEGALAQVLSSFQPDLVGLSCIFTCLVNSTLSTARQVRVMAPKAFIVVGGHASTMAPEHFDIAEVDAIAIGEGERIFPPLVERLERGQEWRALPGLAYRDNGRLRRTQPSNLLVDDLNTLPRPACQLTRQYADRYHLMHGYPLALVSTSRSCPYRCTFCAVASFYRGRCRYISPDRIVQVIESTPNYFVMITDDNFLMNTRHAQRMAASLDKHGLAGTKRYFCQTRSDAILRSPEVIRAWKDLGLSEVFLGIEGVDEDHLTQYDKRVSVHQHRQAIELLHRQGLNVWGGFIIDPDFEEHDFERMRRFILDTGIEYPVFGILTPYPGTQLWHQRYAEFTTYNWDYFDTMHPVLPTKLPYIEFYRRYAELYRSLYQNRPHESPSGSPRVPDGRSLASSPAQFPNKQ